MGVYWPLMKIREIVVSMTNVPFLSMNVPSRSWVLDFPLTNLKLKFWITRWLPPRSYTMRVGHILKFSRTSTNIKRESIICPFSSISLKYNVVSWMRRGAIVWLIWCRLFATSDFFWRDWNISKTDSSWLSLFIKRLMDGMYCRKRGGRYVYQPFSQVLEQRSFPNWEWIVHL